MMMEGYRIPSSENNLTAFIANPSGFDMGGREYLYRITGAWRKLAPDHL